VNRIRTIVVAILVGGMLAACGDDGGGSTEGGVDDKTPVTITVWSAYTDRELGVFEDALAKFHEQYPWITVDSVGGQGDDKITAAIRGGNPPDVAMSFSADSVGAFCSSGAFTDLGPRIEDDDVDLSVIPQVVLDYTEFEGTRCVLPMLTDAYGLYYNKDMLEAAGFDAPPETLTELRDMADALTTRKADGSIDVAGFVPLQGFYENSASHWAPMWGATWLDSDGKSSVASDSAWNDMLTWQKDFIDDVGYDDLRTFVAGAGDEFSPQNMFEEGRIAMILDGEWRMGFIAAETPDLAFGTAPMPVADDKSDLYGSGFTSGTIIGIPKGAEHPEPAWLLTRYLATETEAVVTLANGLKNVPTTTGALESPDLDLPAEFDPFLSIIEHDETASVPTTAAGTAMQDTLQSFIDKWQSGEVDDLQAGLEDTATAIDDLLAQQAEGGAP
jgi:multiple sugar transport system substrate-binding protein